jgi:hypothetical protein
MYSFWNIVMGFCMGTTLSALVLSSSTKQLRTRYERSLNSAIESGEFTLLGDRGQKASSSALFEHLEASLRQVDAPRRNAAVVGLTILFLLATAGAYFMFSG